MKLAWILLLSFIFAGTVVASYIDNPDRLPIYYAIIGFAGCMLLLFLTKVVGKKVLARKEDYYDSP